MTLDAIGCQVGPDPEIQAACGVGRLSQGRHRINSGWLFVEVTRVTERAQLVLDTGWVNEIAIELRRVKTQSKTGERIMAGEAFASAGIMPDLRPHRRAVINREGFIQAFCLNQSCV